VPKLLNIIVACSENRVIGRGGRLPWRIPEDARFFEEQTAGQIPVLGRICFQTWPQAPQRGRRPIVVTHNAALAGNGVRAAGSLDAALAEADALPGEIYICGGQSIYEETFMLPRPQRLHLTLVHAHVEGDRFFPEWRHLFTRELSRRESQDENYRYTFLTLER
jgi:dihydrofolate reductase